MQDTPLEEIPLFARLSAEELEELEEIIEPASFQAGEFIFEEGEPEEGLFILTSGTVEVYKRVLANRRRQLAVMEAPTVVGEMGLLTQPRAAASVSARTSIQAYRIPRDEFLEMLDADSPAACKIIYEIGRTLAERMAKTDESISHIVAELENAGPREDRDLDIFQDRLIEEWRF